MASRLDRLQGLVEMDLQALPERSASPVSDREAEVGILPESAAGEPTEQAQTNELEIPIKTVEENDNAKENLERRFVWVTRAVSSYNVGDAPQLPAFTVKLPPLKLQKGQLAQATQSFTPILALSKFPYKFCNWNNQQDIASAFFDRGKFWAREWDLYYVWDIDQDKSKPLILVLEHQVDQLLAEINTTLKLQLQITSQQREEGLISRFPDHPRLLPRYLGRSTSREEFDDMFLKAPTSSYRPGGESAAPPPTGPTLEGFKKLMADIDDIQKNKNKATREKKKQERQVKQKSMADQFKRAQRYLGLRPSTLGVIPFAVDPLLPAPFTPDRSVVFVCVDVESYEKDHNKITEVGVASLDTRHLAGLAPGENGESWRAKINARHFRIREHKHLVNHEYVSGCPDRFDFGESEMIGLKDATKVMEECFKPPFCAPISMESLGTSERRNIILLGHDTITDINYMCQLGFDPMKLSNLLETQDSAILYRVWRREPQITKLGKILVDFDIIGWNLHNAGNDAVYTIQAMLAVCVHEATIRGTAKLAAQREEDKNSRLEYLTAEAQQRAEEEAEGWSDDEQSNGGGPVKFTDQPNGTGGRGRVGTRSGSNRGGTVRGGRPGLQSASSPMPPQTAVGGRGRGRGRFATDNSLGIVHHNF